MTLTLAELTSPIGEITLAVHDGRLVALAFTDHWARLAPRIARRFGPPPYRHEPDPAGIVSRLRDYLAGNLDALGTIAVDPDGTTFQRAVWSGLRRLPPGRTVAYGELARAIGAPSAVRAVGASNALNPISIVIPCHRVIGADGSLTGYAGGLDRKRWLLQHEGAMS